MNIEVKALALSLLRRAVEIGNQYGVNTSELMVTASNDKAVKFYESKGFVVARHKMELNLND